MCVREKHKLLSLTKLAAIDFCQTYEFSIARYKKYKNRGHIPNMMFLIRSTALKREKMTRGPTIQ